MKNRTLQMIGLPAAAFLTASLFSASLHAEERQMAPAGDDATENSGPLLSEEDMEELSEATRRAIEEFSGLIAPMLNSMGALLQDLPRYEAPEVLPNGDIIIRRYRAPAETTTEDGEIET